MENYNTETKAYYLEINDNIKRYLSNSAQWGKFIAIVGFVGVGIMAVLSVVMIVFGGAFAKLQGVPVSGLIYRFGGIFYLAFTVLYYFPTSFLYKYSIRIKNAVTNDDQLMLDSGFRNLNNLFRFIGIMTIIMLSFVALYLLIVIPVFFVAGTMM
jgi:hypothetical protein